MNNVNPFTELPEQPTGFEQFESDQQSDSAHDAGFDDKPHQITIGQLMMITLLCGATVVAVRRFNFFGTLVLFGVFLIATGSLSRSSIRRPSFQFFNEIMWGLVMPIACLCTDPVVFQNHDGGGAIVSVSGGVLAVYSLVGWQMLNLIAAWFLVGVQANVRAWFAGTFLIGTVTAFTIGICILPLTLIGVIFVIGVLGFTPFLTGYVFLVACKRNWVFFPVHRDHPHPKAVNWIWLVAGIMVAVLVPVSVWIGSQRAF